MSQIPISVSLNPDLIANLNEVPVDNEEVGVPL